MAVICPEHNKEMRSGKFGFFCPTKVGDGAKDWCKYKPKEESKPSAAQPSQSGAKMIELLTMIAASLSKIEDALCNQKPVMKSPYGQPKKNIESEYQRQVEEIDIKDIPL